MVAIRFSPRGTANTIAWATQWFDWDEHRRPEIGDIFLMSHEWNTEYIKFNGLWLVEVPLVNDPELSKCVYQCVQVVAFALGNWVPLYDHRVEVSWSNLHWSLKRDTVQRLWESPKMILTRDQYYAIHPRPVTAKVWGDDVKELLKTTDTREFRQYFK